MKYSYHSMSLLCTFVWTQLRTLSNNNNDDDDDDDDNNLYL